MTSVPEKPLQRLAPGRFTSDPTVNRAIRKFVLTLLLVLGAVAIAGFVSGVVSGARFRRDLALLAGAEWSLAHVEWTSGDRYRFSETEIDRLKKSMRLRESVSPNHEISLVAGKFCVETADGQTVLPFSVWRSRPTDLILSYPRGTPAWVALPDVGDLAAKGESVVQGL